MKQWFLFSFVLLFLQTLNAQTPGTLKWAFETGGKISSSPAIGNDGTVYFGSSFYDDSLDTEYGKFYALNPNGSLKYAFKINGDVKSSPAIASDGTVYICSVDGKLYALNPDGVLKWIFETHGNIYSSPAISSDGTIYVCSFFNESYDNTYYSKLYAINPDGSQKWDFETDGKIYSSPVISSDGTIYMCSNNSFDNTYYSKLYAINPDGSQKWDFEAKGHIYSSLAIGNDGAVYVGTYFYESSFFYDEYSYRKSGKLYAINPDGSLRWQFETNGNIYSSPAIDSDGSVYVGSSFYYKSFYTYYKKLGKFYALNPNGSLKWEFRTGGMVKSSPAIGNDGTVYVGSDDYKLYALNPDGSLKWAFRTGDEIESSPAIGKDSTIYVGGGGKLYAIFSESTGLAQCPWPKFQHDNQNTGRMNTHQIIQKNSNALSQSDTTKVLKNINKINYGILKKLYLPEYIFIISGLAISYDWIHYKITEKDYRNKQKKYQNMKEEEEEKYMEIHKNINKDIHTLNKLPNRIKIEKKIFIGSFVASIAFRLIKNLGNKSQKEYRNNRLNIEPYFPCSFFKNDYGLRIVYQF